jgi:hypothetical protein
VPLKLNAVDPVNNVPRMVTAPPTCAALGEKAVMVGGAAFSVAVKNNAVNPVVDVIPDEATVLLVWLTVLVT